MKKKQKGQQRKPEDYLNLSRRPSLNHLRTELKKSESESTFYQAKDFLAVHFWTWVYHYIKSRFGARHRYPDYQGPETGVYRLERVGLPLTTGSTAVSGAPSSIDVTPFRSASAGQAGSDSSPVTIGIVSDWATGTAEARAIGLGLETHCPDYTIHLGDTYYVGTAEEIDANFNHGNWPRGNTGSFALLGNHEMYSRGVAFFDKLLPTLGLRKDDHAYEGQKAGFFCLENDHWRILGLDTGYHAITKLPGLEMLPWFAGDCRLDPIAMHWLKNVVKLDDTADKRGLLILTHHQYISAFQDESEFQAAADQLATFIGQDRPVIWLWGHEHKLSIFGKAKVGNGITAYGRCIGHGGMPIQLAASDFQPCADRKGFQHLVAFDRRRKGELLGAPIGHNGYVLAKTEGPTLTLEYRDEKKMLFRETWQVDADGLITGSIQPSSDLTLLPDKAWADAIR